MWLIWHKLQNLNEKLLGAKTTTCKMVRTLYYCMVCFPFMVLIQLKGKFLEVMGMYYIDWLLVQDFDNFVQCYSHMWFHVIETVIPRGWLSANTERNLYKGVRLIRSFISVKLRLLPSCDKNSLCLDYLPSPIFFTYI